MMPQWIAISSRIMAMSPRERTMVLCAMLAIIWMIFDTAIISPAQLKQKIYREEISAKREEMGKLLSEQNSILQLGKSDPDSSRKAQLTELKNRIAQMDADLRATQSELVPPDHMPNVLESVLQRDRQVKLVALNSLPVSGLTEGAADDKGSISPVLGIYKHGFEITLEGNYLDLMRYVTELEASPWRMLWGEMSLQAGDYPKSTLKLTLYTLSLDQAWLSF